MVNAAISRALSLLLRLILAVLLSVTSYAEYGIQVALFISLIPLSTLGVSAGISRFSSAEKREYIDDYSCAAIYLVSVLSLIAVIAFCNFLPEDIYDGYSWLAISCLTIGFLCKGILSVYVGSMLARLDTKSAGREEFIDTLIKLFVCATYVLFIDDDSASIFLLYTVSSLATLLLIRPKIKIFMPLDRFRFCCFEIFKACIVYSACSLMVMALFYYVRSSLYDIDKALAAQLDVALLIYSVPKVFMSSMARASIPLGGAGHHGLSFRHVSVIFFIFAFLGLVLLLAYYAGVITSLFDFLQLSSYADSIIPLAILLLGGAFDLYFGVKSGVLFSKGRQKITLYSVIFAIGVLLPVSHYALSNYGVLGSAVIVSLTYILLIIFMSFFDRFLGGVGGFRRS